MGELVALDREVYRYKMKDLCEATGLDRQAIHFYIQQGLLPPGRKTGRNMAWYSEDHVERLRLVRKLQHERFLPLKAIKAILDNRAEAFAPEQHQFLADLKSQLGEEMVPPTSRHRMVDADEVVARTDGIDREDLERAAELGLIGSRLSPEGRLEVAEDDVWMAEHLAEIRRHGFTKELGFSVDVLALYEEAMGTLFREEMRLLQSRLSHLPPAQVAGMLERALPVVHSFLARYHASQVRDFFAHVEASLEESR